MVSSVRIMFGGDVMLGRLVGKAIGRFGARYPLGQLAPLMRSADLCIVNLECAITTARRRWTGSPKAYYFGAPPEALEALTDAGVDLVSLANNHVLDYGVDGLQQTLQLLHRHGIGQTGAGENLAAARLPAIAQCGHMRVGMAAFCNHQADFAAQKERPGIAHIDLHDEPGTLDQFEQALHAMRAAAIDLPILSLHWGPNMLLRPSEQFRRLAHGAIQMGWKILFGHSAHVFQGIELVRGCPILYAAGDLVDDYQVDPLFCNDHQLLFELEWAGSAMRRMTLHPLLINQCQVRPADGAHRDFIAARMRQLCSELGTVMHQAGERLWIDG